MLSLWQGDNKMREIKFRAWDKRTKRMFTPMQFGCMAGCIPPETITEVWHQRSQVSDDGEWITDFDLMQYTGLKDKNGKEIFEGDILRNEESKKSDFYISFDCCWNAIYKGNFALCLSPVLNEKGGCEIIGNIYEHSYLLNKKN